MECGTVVEFLQAFDTEIGELHAHERDLAMLLSEDDVTALAAAIQPGSTAGVLVWENSWAAPFASAVVPDEWRLFKVAG